VRGSGSKGGGEGEGRSKGGEMTQILHAHVNIIKKEKKKNLVSSLTITP
jgi:hypothetical protein